MTVQAVNTNEFKKKFPLEFRNYIEDLYRHKKNHREGVFEQIKKDNEIKIAQVKIENAQAMKNKELAIKSALQKFHKHQKGTSKTFDEDYQTDVPRKLYNTGSINLIDGNLNQK